MKEMNLHKCKGPCSLLKIRILDGTFDGYNKRWVDENGKQWVGRICPDCHREKCKVRAQYKQKASRENKRAN